MERHYSLSPTPRSAGRLAQARSGWFGSTYTHVWQAVSPGQGFPKGGGNRRSSGVHREFYLQSRRLPERGQLGNYLVGIRGPTRGRPGHYFRIGFWASIPTPLPAVSTAARCGSGIDPDDSPSCRRFVGIGAQEPPPFPSASSSRRSAIAQFAAPAIPVVHQANARWRGPSILTNALRFSGTAAGVWRIGAGVPRICARPDARWYV